jgi:type III secretion protein F
MAYTEITKDQITVTSTSAALSDNVNTAQDTLKAALDKLNTAPDDPANLANFQAAVNAWSVTMSLATTIQKTLKETMSQTIQRI